MGSVALTSGNPSTANVSFGVPLASAVGYFVQATAVGSTAAVAAGGVCTSVVSTTGFTLTGPNGVTTSVNWTLFKL
jgi:hypothetical protein